ncbi:MAG: 4-hydroxy-3-methylbut-2-enyl diphosphate reductase [Bacteroidales bacterium]|nr:4-hydroxy-3-methylbut-2-enyl diphosphate reductase [Bacteroidales bacterium]
MVQVEIDGNSGFCGGVIRAIGKAEELLDKGESLLSLGAIVHNEEELERLERRGLKTIAALAPCSSSGQKLLIRAHGVPPAVYQEAREFGYDVVDCTCPVVLKLQKSIREAHARLRQLPTPGQLLIFGKIGHAEVLGLIGQADGAGLVIENLFQLEEDLRAGRINPHLRTEIFSQTTKDPESYAQLCAVLRSRMAKPSLLVVHQTICSQVAGRHRELSDFARRHDCLIFVSGRTSSNGQVLFDLCRSMNARSHLIGGVQELQPDWFLPSDRVGISGATSTPKWLLVQTAGAVEKILDKKQKSI